MMAKLWWYSHRLRSPSPDVQQANLERARARFEDLRRRWREAGRILVAPWLELAEANVAEPLAWSIIEASIPACRGSAIDLDGAPESEGMAMERGIAEMAGALVEELGEAVA